MPYVAAMLRTKTLLALALAFTPAAIAKDIMPVAQQNALVQKYCAVCHTDEARNGGLTLEHFDVSQAAPSLTAMLLSKVTAGVTIANAQAASTDPTAANLVAHRMKTGAMGAAGIAIPDLAVINNFIDALATESVGAARWHVEQSAKSVTASVLREVPSPGTGEAVVFRLVVDCSPAERRGGMQIAWAPAPRSGTFAIAVDGKAPVNYMAEGRESMGNGSQVTAGPAALMLDNLALPERTLAITNLFPDRAVEFSFGDLPQSARQSLAACLAK